MAILQETHISSATRVYSGHESTTRRLGTTLDATRTLLIIAAAKDGSIQIWEQGVETRRFHLAGAHTFSILSLEVKDSILLSTGGAVVTLWDLSTGELLDNYVCEDVGEHLLFSLLVSEELLATGGVGGHIRLFDRTAGYYYPCCRFDALY